MSFKPFNRFAKHERRKPGGRNKTEAAYEAHLELLKRAGQIDGYEFESLKLKLADNTWFTPDFAVQAKDGVMELHDTKGTTTKQKTKAGQPTGEKYKAPWIEEDAAIKLKVTAEKWPFRTYAVFKTPEGWTKQQF